MHLALTPPPCQRLFPWYCLLLLNSNSMNLLSLGKEAEAAAESRETETVLSKDPVKLLIGLLVIYYRFVGTSVPLGRCCKRDERGEGSVDECLRLRKRIKSGKSDENMLIPTSLMNQNHSLHLCHLKNKRLRSSTLNQALPSAYNIVRSSHENLTPQEETT